MTRRARPGRLFFAVLLLLYPRAFRARYRADLLDAFDRDRARSRFAGARGAVRFWRHTISDIFRTAWSERHDRTVRPTGRRRMAGAMMDVRAALRGLARQPGFTLVAILTLGLGVSATTTVFAIVDAVLLTPLPYPNADRLVRVYERERENADAMMVAYGNYEDLRDQSGAFEELAIWAYGSQVLTGVPQARQLRTRETSENFAATLGVRPVLGRWFNRAEVEQGLQVAVLSHELWQSALGGHAGVLGTSILLDGTPYEIAGIMPAGFDFPGRADAWTPLEPVTDPTGRRTRHRHNMIGRLRPGLTMAAARERLETVAARLDAAYPDFNRGNYFEPRRLLDDVVAGRDRALLVFGGAVTALLLIACVNIASIALARAVGRSRELAVRAAIGASPWRLAFLVASEMTFVAVAGGVVALFVANAGVRTILALGGSAIPRAADVVALSPRLLVFALGVSLLSGLAVSVLPILSNRRLGGRDSSAALRGTWSSASRSIVRGRRLLVAAQLTMAFVLAAGAGLLLRSYDKLLAVDTGVVADRVLTMNIRLSAAKYPEPDQAARFLDNLLARIEAVPGIERAGVTLTPPVNEEGWFNLLTVRGRPVPRADVPPISYVVASAGYLEALGVPLASGRLYEPGEPRGEPVAVINQAAAAAHFPGVNPVGQHILGSETEEASWVRVIGVVSDIRQSLTRPPAPEVYVPVAQDRVLSFVLVARAVSGDALQLATAVRSAIETADRDIPITRVMTLDERIGENVTQPRFTAALMTAMAVLAVLLAAAGVFAVVSYSVAERRREFGIRMAMGATSARVLRQVLRESVVLALVAAAAGSVGATLSTGLIESLLFDVSATDPPVYAGVGLAILLVSVGAGLAPALRATSLDPLVVLREE